MRKGNPNSIWYPTLPGAGALNPLGGPLHPPYVLVPPLAPNPKVMAQWTAGYDRGEADCKKGIYKFPANRGELYQRGYTHGWDMASHPGFIRIPKGFKVRSNPVPPYPARFGFNPLPPEPARMGFNPFLPMPPTMDVSKMNPRPPKGWVNKMILRLVKQYPDHTVRRIQQIMGGIWWHQYTPATRKRIIKQYDKKAAATA